MAVNSLYPDGWFALGAAALKAIFIQFIYTLSLHVSKCVVYPRNVFNS